MPSVKNLSKGSQHSSSGSISKYNGMYALLRDQATGKLHVVQHNELISAKNLAKLDVGDIVSHGKRDKRIRATIVLLGNEDQCQQSLQIIERMETPSTQIVTNNKKTTSNMVNHNEKQIDSEDELSEERIDEVEESEDELAEEKIDEVEESEEGAPQSTREEDEEFLGDQMEKENIEAGKAVPPSRVLTNLHQQSPRLNTESFITLKRKTLPGKHDNCVLPHNKRSKNAGFVSMRPHAKLVTQLAAAEEQNQLYQVTWMPRPVDKATIQYFITTGKVLSDDVDDYSNGNITNTGDLLKAVCLALDMTEGQLNVNTGKTILSTARQLISAKYPDPTTVFAEVEKEHIQAIIEYAWLIHPAEKKSNDEAKIRYAMGNVFASRTFLRKLKLGGQSSESSILKTKATNTNKH